MRNMIYVGATLVAAFAGAPVFAQDADASPAASAPAAQETPWGTAEVDAYILANRPRPASASDDPFSVPAAPPAPARSVVFTYDVGRSGADGVTYTEPQWAYDAAKQELTLTARPSSGGLVNLTTTAEENGPRYENHPRVTDYFETFEEITRSDGGTRSNAYGASVQVTEVRTTSRGLTHVVRDRRLYSLPSAGDEYRSAYEFKVTISPEEARALVGRLRFVVTAQTEQWTPGKWIICGTSYNEPTFQRPTEHLGNYCFLNAVVTAVGFIDMGDMSVEGDGKVLAEWSQVRRSRY